MSIAPVPISALEHYRYCPRQSALILVDGVWVDNAHTVRGSYDHRRADIPAVRVERGRRVQRAVPLWSEMWGLTGRADAVEWHPNGEIVPVEYKSGRRHGDTADVQLCAEAFCLEEMLNTTVDYGQIWYSAVRRRRRITFTDDLRELTATTIRAVHELFEQRTLPPPEDDERCDQCQLVGNCLPHLVANTAELSRYLRREVWSCES